MHKTHILMACIVFAFPLSGIDNPHFYRATNFLFCEPRIEHDHFSSFDGTLASGKSSFTYTPVTGTFSLVEANISSVYTLPLGFFFAAHIPFRSALFTHLLVYEPNNLISLPKQRSNGPGDLTTLIGWTHNYQNTKKIDFIDFSCMAGLLSPTGKTTHNDYIIFPLGYNGHWAASLNVMSSVGIYEWITFGGSVHTLIFNKQKQPLWNADLFLKADHFMYGLSFTLGYAYATEHDTLFEIKNYFHQCASWNMHTLQLYVEYDFAKQQSNIGPRIGLLYNHVLKGKNIFTTSMIGGVLGVDIAWDF